MRRRVGAMFVLSLLGCVPAGERTPARSDSSATATASATAPATAPAPAPATATADAGGGRRLDAVAALHAAQDAGLKATVIVAYPIECPAVPAPTGDPKLLAAHGKLAATAVDVDGFLREDIGVAEAVALFGPPVLCSREPSSAYMNLELAPRKAEIHEVRLETHDGELIGIGVELTPPVPVDLTDLTARFGTPRKLPGPMDAHEAGSDSFAVKTAAFSAQLSFAHRDHTDPPTRRQVHEILFRRTAMLEILPETFRSESDLVRLVALTLRGSPPEPVGFAGSLGLYESPVGDRLTFTPVPERNVTSAFIDKRTVAGRELVRAVSATFDTPVILDPAHFAKSLGTALHVATPSVATDGARTRIDLGARGKVLLDMSGRTVKTIAIERAGAG